MRCLIYLPSNCNMEIIVRSVKENLNAIKHVEEMMDGLFPEEEQSSVNGLLELSVNSGVHFDLYYLNGEVCGFSYIVCKYDLVFIYYLAVKEKYQSMGCGTKILEIIKCFYNNSTLVLNIEPINGQTHNQVQRLRRLKFYKKNGLKETNYFLEHKGVEYSILSSAQNLDTVRYKKLLEDISCDYMASKIYR